MKSMLPNIWDLEYDSVALTYDLKAANISDFATIRRIAKDKYLFEADPKYEHIGKYSAPLTLTDNNKYPRSTDY